MEAVKYIVNMMFEDEHCTNTQWVNQVYNQYQKIGLFLTILY